MSIQEHLNKIRNAVYGREVRESIAKGIETAYDDASENGNANMEVKVARGTHPNLRSRLEEVDNKQQQTTAQLAHKVGNGKLATMADMGQDVKEAMTGGSVAVVGINSILKENIVDNQVTPEKVDFVQHTEQLIDEVNVIEGVYEREYLAGYYNPENDGKVFTDSGELVETDYTSSYTVLNRVQTEENVEYAVKARHIHFIDSSGKVNTEASIDNNDIDSDGSRTEMRFTVPKSTEYIILTVDLDEIDTLQIARLSPLKHEFKIYSPNLIINQSNIQEDIVEPEMTTFIEYDQSSEGDYGTIIVGDFRNTSNDDKALLSNGFLGASEYSEGYTVTDFIDVYPNSTYMVSYRNVFFYDDNNLPIPDSLINNTGYGSNKQKIRVTAPDNASKMRITVDTDSPTTDTIERITPNKKEAPIIIPKLKRTSASPLEGKKGVYIGTSLGATSQYTQTRADYISHVTRAEIVNGALGGSRATSWEASDQTGGVNVGSSGAELVDDIVTGDYSDVRADINNRRSGSLLTKQLDAINLLENTNFNSLDFIIIEYMTNDILQNIELGEIDYDKSTFKGALSYIVRELQRNFPQLKILLVSGVYAHSYEEDGNNKSLTTKDYVQAMKEVADVKHLKFCDLYTNANVNEDNYLHFFNSNDLIHPKESTGIPHYSELIINSLEEMF